MIRVIWKGIVITLLLIPALLLYLLTVFFAWLAKVTFK